MRDHGPTFPRTSISPAMEQALVVIKHSEFLTRQASVWKGEHGPEIQFATIKALWVRYLIKIVVDSRHRTKQFARLTDIGYHVAASLERGRDPITFIRAPHKISEKAARFITEVTS